MNFKEIISDINNNKFSPLYFLTGNEPFFIDQITDKLDNSVLSEDEKHFNRIILYGKETSPQEILSYTLKLPMNAPYNLVIVKEAQYLGSKINKLEHYINSPLKNTILVICYKNKTLDGRAAFTKLIKKKALYFESKKLYENQIPDFINSILNRKGIQASTKTIYLLSEYLGNDLKKIHSELNKLSTYLNNKSSLEIEDVIELIGINREYNSFELTKALSYNNKPLALSIMLYLSNHLSKNPFPLIIAALTKYYLNILTYHYTIPKTQENIARKLSIHPFFVKEFDQACKHINIRKAVGSISLMKEYDLKLKGVKNYKITSKELLKELMIKLLYLD